MGAKVVTFGELMALFLTTDGRPLGTATAFRLAGAGAEATVAIGLTRLGHETVRHVLRLARAAGTPVSFDPNVRPTLAPPSHWRAIFEEFVPSCDIVLTGWPRGEPPAGRPRQACVVAALAIGAPGDIAGLPDDRTVRAVLAGEGDVTR